jgi:diaminobutyrate-2-oxoglutarate transaminase
MADFTTFETIESEVRSYCRAFPAIFEKAQGSCLYDTDGRRYLDFFSGAGTLNYGHANPRIKRRVIDYLEGDGIIHSLDMATGAKGAFLERLREVILEPRGFDYKVQFPSPTGTNAVEACLKLARKATGRKAVLYFNGAFHGMTLGALSVSGDLTRRESAGIPLDYTVELPFEHDAGGPEVAENLEKQWSQCSEEDLPAALILETVQAEGGVRAASAGWLRRLQEVTKRFGVLLIVDDIQVGCGRTGSFFSFEEAGLEPDLVCLSKSIGGLGLPLALVLLRPALDIWSPGEHNGTFRGQNLSFVAATEALSYWQDGDFGQAVVAKAKILRDTLDRWVVSFPDLVTGSLGRGLIQGLSFTEASTAGQISRAAFEQGLVIECAGSSDQILKFLPPLTISEEELQEGLEIVEQSLEALGPQASTPTLVALAAG